MNKTIVGVDLAKKVIQVCIYTNRKVHSNTEMTPKEFTCWLVNSMPATIVYEACGTSNYWKQLASSHGHDARLISSRLVAVVRQNQKTDKNDALAIVQASLLPDVNFIQGKTAEQQQLQSIVRLRELSIRQKTASKNQLIALLSELNIQVSNRNGGLRATIDETLEDADNGFSPSFRQAISTAWDQYSSLVEAIDTYDDCLEKSLSYQPECKKLLKIEGVGTLNAVNLYIALGCADIGAFSKGKAAAACIGLTPIQHSSGGRAKIGSIGRGFKNTLFRSQLLTGAMSIVSKVANRPPKTKKEEWLKNLIERRGKKCAAVALANKNVRTAFAILTQGTEYKAEPLVS
ncbi:IS110 family transposase [Vibrio splendidus]|uniref:Transposase n=1 Tax=Vibrio splendidus TaxID=29497 RepID=A0A2N7JQ62_VIBSP|nr:IS110 family transposase [Vibrio splendidus]PMM51183.1 transposase [Vibrio splendidus]